MLTVRNTTRDVELITHGRMANNSWTRLKGLIGVRDLPKGDGLLISPCKGIHCMFMSIPIDVIYADKEDRVVAVDHGMRPWRMGKIYRKSRYVIELPEGALRDTGTVPGDRLEIGQH